MPLASALEWLRVPCRAGRVSPCICIRPSHVTFGARRRVLVILVACGILAQAEQPSFSVDVMSVLSKAGCNAGTCHGNLNGKGGFKLSLRGQDPEFDYRSLVMSSRGRRVNFTRPDKSLFLRKASWPGRAPRRSAIRIRFARVQVAEKLATKWRTEPFAEHSPRCSTSSAAGQRDCSCPGRSSPSDSDRVLLRRYVPRRDKPRVL